MERYINSKGRQIIGWDEILQGGLAPNARVMSWLGEEGGIKAAQQHHEVVMAPYPKYYLDYWQADPDSEPLAMGGPTLLRTMYEYNPVPDVLDPEQQKYIIGVEGCVWTEYMPTPARVEYMAWPRMCAIAESGWSSAPKDWEAFTRRLETHLGRLDELDVGYCKAFYDRSSTFARIRNTARSPSFPWMRPMPRSIIRWTAARPPRPRPSTPVPLSSTGSSASPRRPSGTESKLEISNIKTFKLWQ